MGRRLVLGVLVVLCALTATAASGNAPSGRTLHVSPAGDDSADGLSPATAWTLARASAAVLRPGDRLLLQGGARFPGTLELGPQDAGDPARPVVIGAFRITCTSSASTSAGSSAGSSSPPTGPRASGT
jgi:hypothetical protein